MTNFETLTVLTSAVNYFTVAKIIDPTKWQPSMIRAFCTITGGQLNFTVDGTTPTTGATGVGHYAQAGDKLTITGEEDIRKFQCIAATATVTVACSYSNVDLGSTIK